MTSMRPMIALVIALFVGGLLQAQKTTESSFILHLDKNVPIESVMEDVDCPVSSERIDQEYHYYVVSGECISIDVLQKKDGVLTISPNLPIHPREVIPNDPEYGNQNSFDIIGMPEAWEYTTGGITKDGHSVVMVAMDERFALDHPDLVR